MSTAKRHTRLSINLVGTNRAAIRAEVFQYWINENPGTATLFNTYRYDVEKLSDNKSWIYLTRPAFLNKGADFVINCENYLHFKNGNCKPPKHSDLVSELKLLISKSAQHEKEILRAIHRIWNCEPSTSVLSDLSLFANNLQAERAILLAKWFFIEQDVTYWTESGRNMLRGEIKKHFGELP